MPWGKLRRGLRHPGLLVGVNRGVLTLADPDGGRSVSIAWPAPPPKDDHGSWQPVVLEEHADGTSTMCWRWEEFTEGRADEPPAGGA